eukprot:scaffold269460_cov33-Tisochrysis_lutea.AAC.1
MDGHSDSSHSRGTGAAEDRARALESAGSPVSAARVARARGRCAKGAPRLARLACTSHARVLQRRARAEGRRAPHC